jgi:hypothetical protein
VRTAALFLAVTVALTAVVGWILGYFFRSPAEHHAILVSAVVAVVVQLLAFTIMRLVKREHVIAGWGVGVILRFAVLAVYGLVIAKAMGLPSAAALVSLAAFFFVSTTVEPLFVKR